VLIRQCHITGLHEPVRVLEPVAAGASSKSWVVITPAVTVTCIDTDTNTYPAADAVTIYVAGVTAFKAYLPSVVVVPLFPSSGRRSLSAGLTAPPRYARP
jgi:hypothetical protein